MAEHISRRALLRASSLAGMGVLAACDGVTLPGLSAPPTDNLPSPAPPPGDPSIAAAAETAPDAPFQYTVQYSEQEWRARLTPAEYRILRDGETERRNSHRFTQDSRDGAYHCQGCTLTVYTSDEKIILDAGWVFFHHAIRDTVLLGVDDGEIEAHCRRCGSHLGHILDVDGDILHCINGTALGFTLKDA